MTAKEKEEKYILKTYNRYPFTFTHGEGAYLYTETEEKYLDFSSGIAVTALGHNHHNLVNAVKLQAEKVMHLSNLYNNLPNVDLAEKLVESTIFDKAFFCNSGAEANEAAMKLARKYGSTKNKNKTKIITMTDSFHGRTLATITATGQTKYQKGFSPLPGGFEHAKFNDLNDIEAKIDNNTAAVIVEVIQGESGIRPANKDFLEKTRELCNKHEALLIFDEVQTGVGRTGELFAYELYPSIKPDAITLAKGLGGGLPIGALLVSEKINSILQPGDHASTFGGNPVSCAAALAVINTIEQENLLANVKEISSYLKEKLNMLKEKYSSILEIRGKGLMIGIEINYPGKELISALLDEKILTVPAGTNVVRFLPPLNITTNEIDILIEALDKCLK